MCVLGHCTGWVAPYEGACKQYNLTKAVQDEANSAMRHDGAAYEAAQTKKRDVDTLALIALARVLQRDAP